MMYTKLFQRFKDWIVFAPVIHALLQMNRKFNHLSAILFNLNFHPLEAVSYAIHNFKRVKIIQIW